MRRRSILLAALAVSAVAPAAVAAADPAVTAELPLRATPGELALGADGSVWAVLDGAPYDLARIAPGGAVTELDVAGLTEPAGIAAGPDGNLWVTQSGGVARVVPAAPATATVVPIPELTDPVGIAVAADGTLWTASGDRAIRVTTAGLAGTTTVPGMAARAIAADDDGRLYLADAAARRIVVLEPTGTVSFQPAHGDPQRLAAGPAGQIAFTNAGDLAPSLGRLTRGYAPALTPAPGHAPLGIAFGTDGAYWAADPASGVLLRLTPDGRVSTLGGLPPGARPSHVAAGADGTLWVSLEGTSAVARVDGLTATLVDETAPAITAVRGRRTVRRGRPWTMRLRLSEPATLGVNWWSGRDVVAFQKIRAAAGRVVVRLGGRRLRPGRHRVTIAARDAAGNLTQVDALRLRVLPRRP